MKENKFKTLISLWTLGKGGRRYFVLKLGKKFFIGNHIDPDNMEKLHQVSRPDRLWQVAKHHGCWFCQMCVKFKSVLA